MGDRRFRGPPGQPGTQGPSLLFQTHDYPLCMQKYRVSNNVVNEPSLGSQTRVLY